jgi:hypothetical protein
VLIDASRPEAADPDAPPIAIIARPLGIQTNNFAEYTAVLLALRKAHELGADEVELVLDSKLIVEQLSGRWKIKHPAIAPLAIQAQAELRRLKKWSIRHEPRANNRQADALANLALDDPRAAAAAEAGAETVPLTKPAPGPAPAPAPVHWAEFAGQAPDLAAAGERMLRAFTLGYLATLREDGAPRVHPITVTLAGGGLWVFVIAGSRRAGDLRRDPRFALHAWPHAWTDDSWDDEEFEIEGRALPINDPRRRKEIADAHNDTAGPADQLFELLIEAAHWKSRRGGRQRIRRWP